MAKKVDYFGVVPPSSTWADSVFMADETTVQDRITALDETVEGLDERVDEVEETVAGYDERLDELESDVDQINENFETINQSIEDIGQDISDIQGDIEDIEQAIADIPEDKLFIIDDGVTTIGDIKQAITDDKILVLHKDQYYSIVNRVYNHSTTTDLIGGYVYQTQANATLVNNVTMFMTFYESTPDDTTASINRNVHTTPTTSRVPDANNIGLVRPDGTTITVDGNGVISAAGGECEVFIVRLDETTYGEARQAWNDKKVLVLWNGNYIAFCRNNRATGSPPSSIVFSGLIERDNRYEGTNAKVESFPIYQISNFDTASDDTVISSYWSDTTKIPAINFSFLSAGTYKLQATKDNNGSKYNWVPDASPVLKTVTFNVAQSDWTRPVALSSRWSYVVPAATFEYDDAHMIIAKVTYDDGTNVNVLPHYLTSVTSGTGWEPDDAYNIENTQFTCLAQTDTARTVTITYWEV